MSTLYLIRHGQASFGSDDYDRLSDTGRTQVAHLRQHLQALGSAPDALWSGSLRRQVDTAGILAEGTSLRPRVDPAFDEYRAEALIEAWLARAATCDARDATLHSRPQSASARDYQRLLEAAGTAWVRGEFAASVHTPWAEFRASVANGLEALLGASGRGRRIGLCTSAGVIGAALGHVLRLDDLQSLALSWTLHNTSVTALLFDGNRISLASFNGLPHLERPGLGQLITYR